MTQPKEFKNEPFTDFSKPENLQAQADADLIVADEPEDFADAIIRLFQSKELRTEVGQSARARIEHDYTSRTLLTKLDSIVAEATPG